MTHVLNDNNPCSVQTKPVGPRVLPAKPAINKRELAWLMNPARPTAVRIKRCTPKNHWTTQTSITLSFIKDTLASTCHWHGRVSPADWHHQQRDEERAAPHYPPPIPLNDCTHSAKLILTITHFPPHFSLSYSFVAITYCVCLFSLL